MTQHGGRIVHVVCTDAFAGVERHVADAARGLADRGRDVTVIGGDPERMRRALGDAVPHLPGGTLAAAARALLATRRAAVVHAHMTAAELPAALLARHLGARLVVTRHFARRRGSTPGGRLAAAVIRRRVDLQISPSEFVAASVGEPTRVLANGVAPSELEPRPRDDTVVVLQRLEAEKDTATALRAWACSGLAAEGWRLEIHGDGAELARLRALAREHGVTDSVTFAGFTDAPREVLAGAGILLATAPAEPFGLAVVEAMAEGTPVVAADGGAHRETLGASSRLFEAGDHRAAARELRDLASDPALRAAVGAALRTRHHERFTVQQHVDGLVALYDDVLRTRP